MFQQTFITSPDSSRKPMSMGFSLLLQAAAIALLALIPLLYTPGLPSTQLRSLLLAPPPPTAPVVNKAPVPPGRIPTAHRFVFHPDTINPIPRPTTKPMDAAAAPGLDIPGVQGDPEGATSTIFGPLEATAQAPPPPAPVAPKVLERKPLRVGGGVAEANLIQRVQPIYPPLARSARVSGTVEFTATISREGLIENLQLVRGHPLLVNAARQAILQWRYRPTQLNGQPVEVITNILVTFNLN